MHFIIRLVVNALALVGIAYWLPGIEVDGFYVAVIAAVIIGILNAVIRPLFAILTLPITLVTFGLSTLVVNVLVFWFVASFVDGFDVETFAAAAIGAILLWAVSFVSGFFLKKS